jgi:hypothetical protein
VNKRAAMRWILLAIAALAFAGCGSSGDCETTTPQPAAAQSSVPATPAQPTTVASVAPDTTATAPAPSSSGEGPDQMFWHVTDDARGKAGGDVEDQYQDLWSQLHSNGGAPAMHAYAESLHKLDESLYTWNVWGAASVAEDGCSDDCFDDFRMYVISLGPRAYAAAVRNPDSLASTMPSDADWSDARDQITEAYDEINGQDPELLQGLDGDPRGQPLDDLSSEELAARYPELAARFG